MKNGKTGITTETIEVEELEDSEEVSEEPVAPKGKGGRRWLQLAGLVLLVVGAIFGWRWWQFSRTHVSTENAQIQGHVSPISSRISATVKEIKVKDGDRVEVGQTLVVLEDDDLALRIRQAEAKLAVANAQLKSATDTIPVTTRTNDAKVTQSEANLDASNSAVESSSAGVTRAEAAIRTNQAKTDQARAELSRTEADFKRYETLFRQGDVSEQRFESARTAYESARAGVTAAERMVDQSKAELRDAQSNLRRAKSETRVAAGQVTETRAAGETVVVQRDQQAIARAQVEQAQAELDLARKQAGYTVIVSPVAGFVGELTAQVGQKIEPTQSLMAVVPLDNDRIYVEANFKETVLGRLHPGQKADVEVDAFPGETFKATVEGISPATGAQFALIPPDNATGNYNKVVQWVPVRLVFDKNADPLHKLRPGLSLTVIVDTAGAVTGEIMKPAPLSQAGYVTGPLKWAIALTAALGAILEVIDTSIVNVALTDIQASVGATVSEVGWVVTSYGIANVVLIPLSAWLGHRFGKKNYFVFSMVGFTAASVLCGLSTSLSMLIAARILQGLFGGGLLAKAQAILFETFPPAEQGLAQAIFGVGVIVGPAIGPTLGGYLTDTLGWRWIFFINLPIGILAVAMSILFLQPDGKRSKTVSRVDWWGILLLIISIGSIQTFLEEGQSEGWFDSRFIQVLAVSSVVGLGLFIWRELTVAAPAVDLRVLKHRSLAAGSLYSGILGMGLYGALFAVPLFTQSVLGFSATQTGWMLAPGAIASAFVMIGLGKFSSKVDARWLVGAGAIGTSLTMLWLARITPQTGVDELFWPLMWRGATSVLMFLPLSLAALGSLPKDAIAAGSGFYNLTRQMGGSIGVAVMTTILQQREFFHRNVVLAKLTPYSAKTNQQVGLFTELFHHRGYDAVTAHTQALKMLGRSAQLQIAVLSYADVFRFVAMLFIVTLPLLWFLGKGGKGRGIPDAH